MTTELTMLAYAVALLIGLVFLQAVAGVRALGLLPAAGSRDGLPQPEGFHARMKRVVDNHREGLIMFAPLALIAAAQGLSTPITVLAAQLFFFSRAAHAVLYVAGAPYVRPLVWAVGIAGTIMMLLAVLGLI